MKDAPVMATQKTETSNTRTGVLPGVVHLAIDVADKGQSTAIAVLQDARVELRVAVEHGIELAEKLAAASFRFARKAVQRIDDASNDTLASAGTMIGGVVKSARETTTAAAQLANTAASGVTAQA
jgi:hypothetical protein